MSFKVGDAVVAKTNEAHEIQPIIIGNRYIITSICPQGIFIRFNNYESGWLPSGFKLAKNQVLWDDE